MSRRRSKDNAATLAAKATDEAFANLPHVPMTDNLAPMGMFNMITTYSKTLTIIDIAFACFFSQHRPISVYHPIPQTYSKAHFDRIFETRPEPRSGKIKPQDVIYTLAGAVNAFEQASQSPEERAARSDLHEEDRSLIPNLEELVKQFRPFNVPPPPTPFDMSAGGAEETQARRVEAEMVEMVADEEPTRMTYQTTVTIEETTTPEGDKTFTASATPIIVRNSAARASRQPFLTRMAQRQMVLEPGNGEDEGMMLISVKRQRKLKMKKHKYKKLMKRTRNLRRKLGKT